MTDEQTRMQFLIALNSNAYINMCTCDDMVNVISALEKQIPEKPVGDLKSVPHYRCPKCFGGVKMYEDSIVYPYCHHCGQKLDWE